MVGGGEDSEGVEKCFVYSGGQYTELLPPGWVNACDRNINNNGEVVGGGEDSEGVGKGFIYSDGQYTELMPPGGINARFNYINNNEDVVGEVDDGSGLPEGKKGVIYSGGKYTFFLPHGMNDIRVAGINDSGEVIGSAQDPDSFTLYGFVYRNGRFTYLPAWVIPCGINNKGVMVGHAGYYQFGVQGFIATPVTTPK